MKDYNTIIKWVELGLSHLIEYLNLNLNMTRTRYANPNWHSHKKVVYILAPPPKKKKKQLGWVIIILQIQREPVPYQPEAEIICWLVSTPRDKCWLDLFVFYVLSMWSFVYCITCPLWKKLLASIHQFGLIKILDFETYFQIPSHINSSKKKNIPYLSQ